MKKFLLLVAVAIVGFVIAGCSTSGGAVVSVGTSPSGLEIPIEQATLKFNEDVGANTYKVVNTDELKKWMDEGKELTIVSTLPAEDDKKFGTIEGAINSVMPKTEQELTKENEDALLEAVGPDKEKTIITYCGFVACRRSHHAAATLSKNGYENVYRYPGGIIAWTEAGNAVTK